MNPLAVRINSARQESQEGHTLILKCTGIWRPKLRTCAAIACLGICAALPLRLAFGASVTQGAKSTFRPGSATAYHDGSYLGEADHTSEIGRLILVTLRRSGSTSRIQSMRADSGAMKVLQFTGVNIAGGEFHDPKPGASAIYGQQYIYPAAGEFEYFASKGMNIVRFPFRWEDLQPELNGPLREDVLKRIDTVVYEANSRGIRLILDPHNYARYYGQVVGTSNVPIPAFANFWSKVAKHFAAKPLVWFGLMNEPHDMPTEQWFGAAQAVVTAIRKSGAPNMILVPGNNWTGAHSWVSSGNGALMLKLHDPQNHFMFDVHQYLDADCSGTSSAAVSETIGSERLKEFTEWCRANNKRGFLGEFAGGDNPQANAAIADMLAYMGRNSDVWAGFTWWAAGAWWGEYKFTIEPKDGRDRAQMNVLKPYLQKPSLIHRSL